jgi:hypothetical protein
VKDYLGVNKSAKNFYKRGNPLDDKCSNRDNPNHPVPGYLCSAPKSYETNPGNSRAVAHTCFFTVLDAFSFPTHMGILPFNFNHLPFLGA